jgi:hypothetical protein
LGLGEISYKDLGVALPILAVLVMRGALLEGYV